MSEGRPQGPDQAPKQRRDRPQSPRARFEAAAGDAPARSRAPGANDAAIAQAGDADHVPAFHPGDPAVAVLSGLPLAGAVGGRYQGATIRMSGRRDGRRELLMYDLTGSRVMATFDADADGGDGVTLHLTSDDRDDAYRAILSGIRYLNRAARPTEGERRFDAQVTDATGIPVPVGARALFVDGAVPDAAGFDTLAPEVLRFQIGANYWDTPIAFEARRTAPPAAEPEPAPAPARRRAPPPVGQAAFGAPAAVASPAPATARVPPAEDAGGYRIHRPAGAHLAADGAHPHGTAIPASDAEADAAHSFLRRGHRFRIFSHSEEPRPWLDSHFPEAQRVSRRPTPAHRDTGRHEPTRDRGSALYFEDLFEVDADDHGLLRGDDLRAALDQIAEDGRPDRGRDGGRNGGRAGRDPKSFLFGFPAGRVAA